MTQECKYRDGNNHCLHPDMYANSGELNPDNGVFVNCKPDDKCFGGKPQELNELREKIAQFCHNKDFQTGFSEGEYAQSWSECPESVKATYFDEADQILSQTVSRGGGKCSRCKGEGILIEGGNPCQTCKGSGSLPVETKTVKEIVKEWKDA